MHARPKQEHVQGREQDADQPDTRGLCERFFEEAGKVVDDEAGLPFEGESDVQRIVAI